MIDLERVRKLLILALRNKNAGEAKAALKAADRAAAGHAVHATIRRARQERARPEVDRIIEQALRQLVEFSETASSWSSETASSWSSETASSAEDQGGGRFKVAGMTVVANAKGRGYRVVSPYGPTNQTPLMTKAAAFRWAAAYARSGNGMFASRWVEPEDGSHLPEEPEEERKALAGPSDQKENT